MLSLASSRPMCFFVIICSVATLDSALTICIFEVNLSQTLPTAPFLTVEKNLLLVLLISNRTPAGAIALTKVHYVTLYKE